MTSFDAKAKADEIVFEWQEPNFTGGIAPLIEQVLLKAYSAGQQENHQNCVYRHEVDKAYRAGQKVAYEDAVKMCDIAMERTKKFEQWHRDAVIVHFDLMKSAFESKSKSLEKP